jgi:hypothetical protein
MGKKLKLKVKRGKLKVKLKSGDERLPLSEGDVRGLLALAMAKAMDPGESGPRVLAEAETPALVSASEATAPDSINLARLKDPR